MKRSLVLLLPIFFAACNHHDRNDGTTTTDTLTYPLLIDNGTRMVYQREEGATKRVYYDTITLKKGDVYRNDTLNHPLQQFYISYPEWETIRCVIAVDETDYWDKAMIGLIEKTGALRIHYNHQKIHLLPDTNQKMTEGPYQAIFKNDTLQIHLSAHLERKRILNTLTGNGTLKFKHHNRTVVEPVFLVYDIGSSL